MPEGITGLRVRFRWPDGGLSDSAGVITSVSPSTGYPEWWPLGDRCGYLPATVNEAAWRASFDGRGQEFLRLPGDVPAAVTARELQCRQFATEARMPGEFGCGVRWDAVVTDGGLVVLPGDRWRESWVADSRWLATADGQALEVPPLIEQVPVSGGVL